MSLTPQFLDELRARTSLSTLIGRTVKVQKAGREYKACCPFHNEKTPSFTINDEKGFYHCFGCGAHGDAIRWMTDQRGLPFMEAVKELAATAGMEVPAADPRAAKRAEQAKGLHEAMAAAQSFFEDQLGGLDGGEARAYLGRRGISDATRRAFGFGYAPDARGKLKTALRDFGEPMLVEAGLLIDPEGERDSYDRFRGRLMLPIRDIRGRVIAFGGRILGDGEPKYLNSPDTPLFDKGRTLYNIDKASPASRQTGRVIVVEGYMDVIALAQAGFADAVAPLGTALTEHQIERLWKMVEVPILCFDGDAAGQKAADRAAIRALPILKPGCSLSFVSLPAGMDPDDVVRSGGKDKFETFLALAKPLVQRVWEYELKVEPTDTPEARAGLQQRINDRVASIAHPLVRKQYADELRNRFFEQFGWGWKRSERNRVRGYISDSREEARNLHNLADRIDYAVDRAIILGLCRWPNVLYSHREHLAQYEPRSKLLESWLKFLISVSFKRPALDESILEAIAADENVPLLEKRDIVRDLRFTFYSRTTETATAESDLSRAIEVIVTDQELARQMAQYEREVAARHSEEWMSDDDWERHQHIHSQRRAYSLRIQEYKANQEELLAA
ncbi:DNA primase [uncultured Sphingobium sp.]|uniref:DNA primase n=1 Tax=uncultured Sphingobium sp. TaxID=316087 RepID=UPI00261FE558|nr:DNA primase [uncultured Sphingobium sp.]